MIYQRNDDKGEISLAHRGVLFLDKFPEFGTRVIEERRTRLLTILLVPFTPCTARMTVITFLAPAFFGERATLITWGLVIINIIILALTGIVINRAVFKGAHVAFIFFRSRRRAAGY